MKQKEVKAVSEAQAASELTEAQVKAEKIYEVKIPLQMIIRIKASSQEEVKDKAQRVLTSLETLTTPGWILVGGMMVSELK